MVLTKDIGFMYAFKHILEQGNHSCVSLGLSHN